MEPASESNAVRTPPRKGFASNYKNIFFFSILKCCNKAHAWLQKLLPKSNPCIENLSNAQIQQA